MKKLIFALLSSLMIIACNADNTAPKITFAEDTFCTTPGGTIEVSIQIEEENTLDELRISASDLDFMDSVEGSIIEANGGMFTAGFTIDPDTPDGTYDLNFQAVDDSENVETKTVTIKIQA